MIKVLEALAGRLSESPEEFLLSLYKDGNKEEMIEESEVIKKLEGALSAKITKHNQDQKNRGIKEGRKAYEKMIKAKGFKSDLTGVDLLEAYLDDVSQTPPLKSDDLTKEAAARLSVVKELIGEKLQAASDKLKETETDFLNYKQKTKLSDLKKLTRRNVREILKSKNVILDDKIATEDQRLDAFMALLDIKKIKNIDDKLIPVDDEGDQERDGFGNPISFESFVISKNTYQVRTQDPSKNAPPRKPGAPPISGDNIEVRDEAHFNELMRSKLSPQDRIKIMESWDKKQNS